MERSIRTDKRELEALKNSGLTDTETSGKIKDIQAKIKADRNAYKDFSEKASLRPKLERTQI